MKNRAEQSITRNTGSAPGRRGNQTRGLILAAARSVFAAHPYNAASIRMIAAQGDFYHGLIRYHFPNKATIFEAVVEEACRTLYQDNKQWLTEISEFPPYNALSTYLDRLIEFTQTHPEVFRIIVNNLSHDDPLTLPGYQHLVSLLVDTQADFIRTFPGLFSDNDAGRFLTCLNALSINFLGAGFMEATTMGFSVRDEAYLQWVKETLLFIFLPVLETVR